jgi:hypothetical protein
MGVTVCADVIVEQKVLRGTCSSIRPVRTCYTMAQGQIHTLFMTSVATSPPVRVLS